MDARVLGWVLIAIGLVSTMAGVIGGIAKMLEEIKRKGDGNEGRGLDALPTEFLKVLIEFLNALAKAPVWLALTIIGFALIAWGGTMI